MAGLFFWRPGCGFYVFQERETYIYTYLIRVIQNAPSAFQRNAL